MPAFLAPHKSGAHRVTAIALYRALLSKCRNTPPSIDGTALRNVVRNTFAKNRYVTSKYILRAAFAGGYEALDHLKAATSGNETSISHLRSLLYRLPSKLKATPSSNNNPPLHSKPTETTPRGAALLARPRPAFSLPSKRRIPVLVSANKIPILRFKKPQPLSLSLYLKSRIKTRQNRIDLKATLEVQLEIAKAEDEWDRILRTRGVGRNGKREGKWVTEVGNAVRDVYDRIEEEGRKNAEMAGKMLRIVDGEKEVAEVERRARRREKNEQRRMRKAEREIARGKEGSQ